MKIMSPFYLYVLELKSEVVYGGLKAYRYRESWVAWACGFPLAWLRVKMSLGPTPRCSDLYVVADVDALLGHWPITFSCLIQRGAFFLALMAS